MLILKKNDIKQIFGMKEAIAACKKALCTYSEGKSNTPLRTNLAIVKERGQSLFMPSYADEINVTGIKMVSLYPGNISLGIPSLSAYMLLFNGKTGEVLAMLEAGYLTQMRTGALQGVATELFARVNSKIAVLFGAGGQAGAQIEAMLNVRDLDIIRVCDINYDRAKEFASSMQKMFSHYKTKIVAVTKTDEALESADIITTVTTSTEPVFNGSLIKKGAHINGIGSYTPNMQELPESIIQAADKIVFDSKESVLKEAGDIIIPMTSGLVDTSNFHGELGEVLLGKIKGRETEEEITVFKGVGMAVLDLVAAHMIYTKALECGMGISVEL